MISARFPYIQTRQAGDPFGFLPTLPIRLRRNSHQFDATALIDSAATMSVLPWTNGSQFQVDWNSLAFTVPVGGSAGSVAGKLLAVEGLVAGFPTAPLLFSWVQTDAYPFVLGQMNFFLTFDICFFRSQGHFEITKRP